MMATMDYALGGKSNVKLLGVPEKVTFSTIIKIHVDCLVVLFLLSKSSLTQDEAPHSYPSICPKFAKPKLFASTLF